MISRDLAVIRRAHLVRSQFPDEYATLCERSLNQNDVESGFSQVASHVGYKPPVSQYLAATARLEFNERVKFDPHRGFRVDYSSHARRADPRSHALTRARPR